MQNSPPRGYKSGRLWPLVYTLTVKHSSMYTNMLACYYTICTNVHMIMIGAIVSYKHYYITTQNHHLVVLYYYSAYRSIVQLDQTFYHVYKH